MLVLLTVWFICGFIFLTFGKLLINICNSFLKDTAYTVYDAFFLGICFVGTILSVFSLWFPINTYSAWVLTAFAVAYNIYLYYLKKDLFLSDIIRSVKNWRWQTQALVLSAILVIACYCLLPPVIFDMRLYYLQSIIWNESYPVVPGLANIHGRFGFNSNILLLSSALSFKDIFSFRTFGVLGISFIVFSIWVIRRIENSELFWQKMGLAFICFIFIYVYKTFIPTPSTDILPNILVIYVLLKAVLEKDSIIKSPALFWILPIYSVTLKLSVIPVCLLCLPIIFHLIKHKQYKALSCLIITGFIIVTAWCTRTVILSGYLVYPYPSIDIFNVDWKVPRALAMEEKASVSSWAKMPGISTFEFEQMEFSGWIKIWLLRHIKHLPLYLFLYCLAGISPLAVFLMWKKKIIKSAHHIFIWFTAFFGFIFWFILAPDGRFGMAFIAAAAIFPLLLLPHAPKNKYVIKIPRVFIILSFIFLLHLGLDIHREYQGDKKVVSYLYAPQTIEIINKKDSTVFSCKKMGEIMIYAPDNFLCSDHDIPCMPFFNPNYILEMRGDKIESGFKVK